MFMVCHGIVQGLVKLIHAFHHLAGLPTVDNVSSLPLPTARIQTVRIQEQARPRLQEEKFIDLAAHIAQVNIRHTGIGQVHAGGAAGVYVDIRKTLVSI